MLRMCLKELAARCMDILGTLGPTASDEETASRHMFVYSNYAPTYIVLWADAFKSAEMRV